MRICITLPSGGIKPPKRICFDIPVLVRRFVPPWEPVEIVRIDDKVAEWAGDAAALSALRELKSSVSKEAARHLDVAAKGLQELIDRQLPEGVSLSFPKTAGEAAR